MYSFYMADKQPAQLEPMAASDMRALPFVQEALGSIAEGGYVEAFARLASLRAAHQDDLLPLAELVKRKELAPSYAEYLPDVPRDQWRRIRGEQEIIARYAPEQAIATLPALLRDRADRDRLLALVDKLMADPRVQEHPTEAQLAMVERLRDLLDDAAHPPVRKARPKASAGPRLH
jgi:hypothetical protein